MKNILATLAAAAALAFAGASHADVLTFDNPDLIDVGPPVVTYTEGGFAISGPSVPFLTISGVLIGGVRDDINGPTTSFSLAAVGGGAFSLMSFDYAFSDFFTDPPGSLSVTGLLNGMQVASQVFSLGASTSAMFDAGFANLTSLTFNGTSGFTLDNVNVQPVPEPATVVLTGIGLLGLALHARRRKRAG